jgi:hypothetical protein
MKQITLIPNQPPVFEGAWEVGEALQMAQLLAASINKMQINQPPVMADNGEVDENVLELE